jgi:hypothetical protein
VTADVLRSDGALGEVIPILERELGPGGAALAALTRGLAEAEEARRRTRLRALLAEVVGIVSD